MGKTDVGDAEDYLAAFAGSYLLSDQQDDEHDHSGRQGAPIDLVYENSEEPRAGRQQNWNTGTCTGHAAESSELHETYHRGGHMQTGSRDGGTMNKAPTEPVDSSEWDQTQERCGSQQGANLMSNTDSPDSVIFSRVAAGGAPQQAEGPIHRPALEGSEGGGHTDSYSHRSKVDNGAGAGMDAEHMQLSHAPQMRRLSLEGREDKGSWDRRESMGGAMMPPISGFAGQGYHGYPSHAGSETPFRRSEGREAWSSGMTDMQGSLDSSAWGVRMAHRMPPAANLSRMHSDMSGLPLRERLPVMRHSYGDVGEGYDGHGPPRASLEMGASHLEAMYGEPSLQGGPSPQGDARRGHRRSSSNGVGLPQPSPTPRRLAARDFHSPQAPGTPSDATRKRRRGDGYPMLEPSMGQELPGFEGMERMAGRAPRQQQEQLIYSLKQQIEGLDQQTQGLLKDTLYRISRNANAANGVVEPSFRTNQRNAYLDKVVANFMYNRFSPSVAARPAGIPPASRFPTPPYLGRASSSPVPYDTGKQTLHMEP